MEKPILFNTEMVQAILKGDKTSTRRPLKKPFEVHPNGYITKQRGNERLVPYEAPYHIGDILYVRETWCRLQMLDDNENFIEGTEKIYYRASDRPDCDYYLKDDGGHSDNIPWRPSIHMPKEVARIFLKVTDVRVEMIRATTAGDCIKEGIKLDYPITDIQSADEYIYEFRKLWDSIYNNWDENPWVWVIEFEKI